MEQCIIPAECQLDLWAKVIVAKDVQNDEPILGDFDEYGEPVPYDLVVGDLGVDEEVICIEDFKISVVGHDEHFICTSRAKVTIDFTAFFWVKTTEGFKCVGTDFTFTKEIPISQFIKPDGTPLTPEEFKTQVEQSEVVVKDFKLAFMNVLEKDPYEPTEQVIEIIVTADIITKLGKFQDVIVYGRVEDC
jgi:hypothetical protein